VTDKELVAIESRAARVRSGGSWDPGVVDDLVRLLAEVRRLRRMLGEEETVTSEPALGVGSRMRNN
jgi:hypothetical protein